MLLKTYRAPACFRHGRTSRICCERRPEIFLAFLVDIVGMINVHFEEVTSGHRRLKVIGVIPCCTLPRVHGGVRCVHSDGSSCYTGGSSIEGFRDSNSRCRKALNESCELSSRRGSESHDRN
jgi:hypothetical protein